MYGLERIGKGQRADELFKKGEVMFGVINGSPKCQGAAAKEWLAEREAELLPVGYFHLACGIFLIVTSSPSLAKMPPSLARVSGAKPVHPEMPMATLVPCAAAGVAKRAAAASAAAIVRIDVMACSVSEFG
jgi:hypothetical protein